jgi:hypothetical protein
MVGGSISPPTVGLNPIYTISTPKGLNKIKQHIKTEDIIIDNDKDRELTNALLCFTLRCALR